MSTARGREVRDSLLLLLAALIWGSTFVAVKAAVTSTSPLLFVAVRFTLATVAALPLIRLGARFARGVRVGIPIGLVFGAAYAAQTVGLTVTTPARSAFITALSVALVPFWGFAVSRVRLGWPQVIAFLLTIPGLWLLSAPGGEVGAWNSGDSWTVVCAVLFALHIALIGRFAGHIDAAGLLIGQLVSIALLCGIASPFLETPRITWTRDVIVGLLLTALLATVLTSWIQIRVQPRVGSNRTAILFATEPVFGALFSFWLTGERLPALGWFGGALILAAVLLSELGPRDANHGPHAFADPAH
ncbi:MAG: DMT family transporter [Candidatus Eisenbacteria bacterium]